MHVFRKTVIIAMICSMWMCSLGYAAKLVASQELIGDINDWSIISADDKQIIKKPSLKDDFYNNINYEWLTESKLPEGYVMINEYVYAEEKVNEYLLQCLSQEHDNQNSNIEISRKIFHTMFDLENRGKMKAGGLENDIEMLEKVNDIQELNNYIINNDSLGICPISFENVGKNDIKINKIELLLKDPSNYLKEDMAMDDNRVKLSKYISYILRKIDYSVEEIEKIIQNNYFIEEELAKSLVSKKELSEEQDEKCITFLENEGIVITEDEIEAIVSNLPIKEMIKSKGWSVKKKYHVEDINTLTKIDELYNDKYLKQVKDYLLVHMLVKYYILQDATAQKYLYEYFCSVYNLPEVTVNNKIPLESFKIMIGELINDEYIWNNLENRKREYFDEKNIIKDFNKALEDDIYSKNVKLTTMLVDENIIKTNLLWNTFSCDYSDMYNIQLAIKKMRIKLNSLNEQENETMLKNEYEVIPFYAPNKNSINIPKGFMFVAENYSKDIPEEKLCMDFIIAHEVAHSIGYKVRKEDNLKNLYSKNEQKWIDFFENIKFSNNVKYDGKKILDEFEADIQAMRYILKVAKTIPDFNYKKLFINYAKMWRSLATKDAVLELIKTDVHPLSIYRVNAVLQQFDEFYEAFDIKKGDKMYLDPKYRYLNTITP